MVLDDGCPALGDLWVGRVAQHSFVPLGLLGRLGYFPSGGDLFLHTFNDPDSHRLAHVAHGKTACETEEGHRPHLEELTATNQQILDNTHQAEGTQRSFPHTWACQESYQRWQRLPT